MKRFLCFIMGNAQTSHLIESEEEEEDVDSDNPEDTQAIQIFCHEHKDAPVSWSVKIGGQWTQYDRETVEQLEMVYASDASIIRLSKGRYFGKPSRSGVCICSIICCFLNLTARVILIIEPDLCRQNQPQHFTADFNSDQHQI